MTRRSSATGLDPAQTAVGSITVPGGDPTVAATNPNPISITINDADGVPVTEAHSVRYWFSDAALGTTVGKTYPDQASTATTGTIIEDNTVADGLGWASTDRSGVLVLVLLENAGAIADHFVNFECGGKIQSQQYSFD